MPIFLVRFDQDINGDDSDHWSFLVKTTDQEKPLVKLVDFLEKEDPEWIHEFDPSIEEVVDYFNLEADHGFTAKDLFIQALEDGSVPILQGRYHNCSTSVKVTKIPEMEADVVYFE